MFGWSEGNTVNSFFFLLIPHPLFFSGCNFEICIAHVVSVHINIELYEQIKHSLNSLYDPEMSNMINYRLKSITNESPVNVNKYSPLRASINNFIFSPNIILSTCCA